jgi:hypothetical protein
MKVYYNEEGAIDATALRTQTKAALIKLLQTVSFIKSSERFEAFWKNMHLTVHEEPYKKNVVYAKTELTLLRLDQFIETWIQSAVESKERFDFFVQAKASEIDGSDPDENYYKALGIRHDQLLALVRVLQVLVTLMQTWATIPIDNVLESPEFQGLLETPLETQIFLEAEAIANQRLKQSAV